MGDVFTLGGASLREASKSVVSALERVIERAKSGDIDGVVVVYSFADGSSGYERTGMYGHSVVGALERAKFSVLAEFEGQ